MKQIKDSSEIKGLNDLGIHLSEKLINITGKVIHAPKIELGESHSIPEGKESFFNLFKDPIYGSKHSVKLGLIYFNTADVSAVTDTFRSTSSNLRVKMEIIKLKCGDYNQKNAMGVIERLLKEGVEKEGINVGLIILPGQMKRDYKKVKSSCLLENGVICQIALEPTLRKKNVQSICTKILLQIIAKRGNTLWVPNFNGKLAKTMIIGFDNAPVKGQNILGMCATVNSTFTSIISKNKVYDGFENKFGTMVEMILQALKSYVERNKE